MKLLDLEKNFKTEEQCRAYIADLRWENGFVCPRCNGTEAWKTSEQKYKCKKCDYKMSVTSGTIFQDSHISLPLWFKAIWYISSQKPSATVSQIQNLLGIGSNRTALSITQKIRQCRIRPLEIKLQGCIEIGFYSELFKNERVTFATIAEITNNKISHIKIYRLLRGNRELINNYLIKNVSTGTTIIAPWWIGREKIGSIYKSKTKHNEYTYVYAKKVKEDFQKWFRKEQTSENFDECAERFCSIFNCSKEPIDFEELVLRCIDPQNQQ